MELTWYGTASITLREGERTIAFDPFGGIAVGELKTPPATLAFEGALQGAEAVFVTHGHFDHILHLPRLYQGRATTVYCTATPRRTLLHHGFPAAQLREIGPGWTGTFGDFQIQAFQGRHCRFDQTLLMKTTLNRRFFAHPGHTGRLLLTHLTYPEKGEILFYEISRGAVRVQIMGSMALDRRTDYPTGADVLVLPLQGRSDQDDYAVELVRRLAPKRVILDHWDNSFPPMTGEIHVAGFVRNVERELGIPCRVLEPGETVQLNQMEGIM